MSIRNLVVGSIKMDRMIDSNHRGVIGPSLCRDLPQHAGNINDQEKSRGISVELGALIYYLYSTLS